MMTVNDTVTLAEFAADIAAIVAAMPDATNPTADDDHHRCVYTRYDGARCIIGEYLARRGTVIAVDDPYNATSETAFNVLTAYGYPADVADAAWELQECADPGTRPWRDAYNRWRVSSEHYKPAQ